ncbi:MAG: nucleoside-triphosphatase [bacterium]
MITVITGPINSGKTLKLLELYHQSKNGDGFTCEKLFQEGKFKGYYLRRLSTNQIENFISLKQHQPNIRSNLAIGKFIFNPEVLKSAECTYEILISKKIEPLYLDEIGPLELNHKGFHDIFKEILASNLDIFFTCRISLVDKIISKFNIKNYSLIKIQQ